MAESAAREEEEQLVKKKGAHSIIWTWFGFKVSDTEQKTVYCKLCKKTVVANGGNTTNLFHHLQRNHVLEYEESQRMRPPQTSSGKKIAVSASQTSLTQAFSRGSPYNKKNQRWNEVTNAVTVYLCKDMVSFQTVDRKGFKDMVKALDPRYMLPAGTHFSHIEMPKLYGKVREQVEKEIRSIEHYATTTDLWSSRTM